MISPSRRGGGLQLSLPTPLYPIFVFPNYRDFSFILLYTLQFLPTFLQFSRLSCPLSSPEIHPFFSYSCFCHFFFFLHRPGTSCSVSLELGILVIVGMRPLNAYTSLRPGHLLDGRSGRPGLIKRLVTHLLWRCLPGSMGSFKTPEYIIPKALVWDRRIFIHDISTPSF